MKYPCLVPKKFCKTSIKGIIYQEGVSEDGEPLKAIEIDTKCNYQDKAKTVLTAEQKLIRIEGTVLIPGDIAPGISVISDGEVEILGVKRSIFKGEKARNPDGTVNYTKMELI